jgi:hypothetical protein
VGGPQHVHIEEVRAVIPTIDSGQFGAALDFVAGDTGIAELVAVLISKVGVAPVGGTDGEGGQGDDAEGGEGGFLRVQLQRMRT